MTSRRASRPAPSLALLVLLTLALPAAACGKPEVDATPWWWTWAKAHHGVRNALATRQQAAEVRAAIDRAKAAMEPFRVVDAARSDLEEFDGHLAALGDEARAYEALEAGGEEIALVLLARASARAEQPVDTKRRAVLLKKATDQRGNRETNAPKVPGMLFRVVPAGTYSVGTPPLSSRPSGNPDPEQGRKEDLEIAPTQVQVKEFWIATTEVTQEVYRQLGGEGIAPAVPGDDEWRPASGMTLAEATAFCKKVGEQDALFTFRLPTEVEWEVACRAMELPTKGPFPLHPKHGDEGTPGNWPLLLETYAVYDSALYAGRSHDQPLPVASRAPNPLGLYDMLGNVEEWCTRSDPPFKYNAGQEPIRGGSFVNPYGACRAGARRLENPTRRGSAIGIRVVAVSSRRS